MVSFFRQLWVLPLSLVLAACGPKPPVARPGESRPVSVGTRVLLDGSGSGDEQRSPLTFSWALTNVPEGSRVLLDDADRAVASFVPDRPGEYTVTLVVATEAQRSSPAQVTLTAAGMPLAHVASQSAVPGQLVVLDGSGSRAVGGGPLAYEWTVADPAGEPVTLTAADTAQPSFRPLKVGTYAVALVVRDGGLASQPVQAAVFVASALRPPVAVVTPEETDAALGAPLRLDGFASHDPDGTGLSWTWTLLHKPAGSSAALATATESATTFTPDALGDYVVSLVVTDASGEASPPGLARVRAVNGAPRAVLADPGEGWVDTPLLLDASATTDPDGDALVIAFQLVTDLPGPASLSAGPRPGTMYLTGTRPGVYGVRIAVTDALGHQVQQARAITFRTAESLALVSGGNQSAAPRTGLSQPVTVEARHGSTPVPNARVRWRAHNGVITSAQGRTDAQGRAVAWVETGRLAGAGKAWAELEDVPAAAAAEAPFVTQPGPVELLVLAAPRRWLSTGGTLVTVRTTDAFGNPVSNATTGSAAIRLSLQNAVTASFDTAVQAGAGLLESGGGTFVVTGKLVDGRFDILAKDLRASSFSVALELLPGTASTPLKLASWWVAAQDDAEGGFVAGWSQAGAWQWKPLVSPQVAGKRAYVAAVPPGFTLAESEARLAVQLPALGTGVVARARYVERLERQSAQDPTGGCAARPAACLLQSSCLSGCATRAVEPLEVPLEPEGCDGRTSLPAAGAGLVLRTLDLTDGLAAGQTQLHFALQSTPNPFTPVQSASWSVDDVLVEYLLPAAGSSAALLSGVIPGPATRVAFTQPDFGNVVYLDGLCANGRPATLQVPVRLLDDAGLPGRTAEPVRLRFDAGQGLEVTGAANATVLGVPGTKQVDVQVDAQNPYVNVQRPAVLVGSPVDVDSTVSVTELSSSGLQLPLQVQVVFKQLTCHNNGSVRYWADTRPQNTFDAAQALRACEVEYGVGQCVVSGNRTLTLTNYNTLTSCPGKVRHSSRAWYFAAESAVPQCNGSTVNFAPGDVAQAVTFDAPVNAQCNCNAIGTVSAPVTFSSPLSLSNKSAFSWN